MRVVVSIYAPKIMAMMPLASERERWNACGDESKSDMSCILSVYM